MMLNARWQFVLLYTEPARAKDARRRGRQRRRARRRGPGRPRGRPAAARLPARARPRGAPGRAGRRRRQGAHRRHGMSAGRLGCPMGSESAVVDLQALQDELAQRAAKEHSGRAAPTLPNPVDGLRQTVIALRAGTQLGEHDSPGPASLLVPRGRVRLVAGDDVIEVGPHELSPVPRSAAQPARRRGHRRPPQHRDPGPPAPPGLTRDCALVHLIAAADDVDQRTERRVRRRRGRRLSRRRGRGR